MALEDGPQQLVASTEDRVEAVHRALRSGRDGLQCRGGQPRRADQRGGGIQRAQTHRHLPTRIEARGAYRRPERFT